MAQQDAHHAPQWFTDFMVEFGKFREQNQREHGELAAEIARAESRSSRWTAGLILGSVTVAVSVLSAVIILVD